MAGSVVYIRWNTRRIACSRWAPLAMLLAALGLEACGTTARAGRDQGVTISDTAPAFRGVRLGDSHAEVRKVLGKPAIDTTSSDVRIVPFGEDDFYDFGLPVNGPDPPPRPPGQRRRPRDSILSYRHVVFLVSTTRAGAYYFGVTAPGTRTSRGVGIGDSLSTARSAYRGVLHCDIANQGSEYPSFPYCGARLAPHVYLYFGQDPIQSIAFASTWLPPGG